MKNEYNAYLIGIGIVCIISFPAVWALFHQGFFTTDDGEWMIIRFSAFYQALKDLQFPVRFLGRLNFSYGYPVATFLYPGFMYFGIFLKVLGFGFVNTIKAVLAISLISSSLFTFLWLSKRYGKVASIVGAFAYLYLPYHLYDVYKRGSVGEVFALAFIPLIFWQIERRSIFWTGVGIGMLILAHNTLAALFIPIIVLYMGVKIIESKKTGDIKRYLLSVVIGMGLSAFFWVPAILELKYTIFSRVSISNPLQYFATNSVIGYSSYLIVLASIILSILEYKKVRKIHHEIFLFEIVAILSIFLASPVSSFLWPHLPYAFIQFPFRMLSLLLPSVAFLSALLVERSGYYKAVTALVLVILIVISVNGFISPKSYFDKGDGYYYTNDATTTVQNEYMPVWVKTFPTKAPSQKVEFWKGTGNIQNIFVNNRKINFEESATNSSILQVNTIYWPGWTAKIDSKYTKITYKKTNGMLSITVPSGTHDVLFSFGESKLEYIADMVSVVSIIMLIFISLLMKKEKS